MLPRFVTIGGFARAELLTRLQESGVHLNEFASDLFRDSRFTTEPVARTVEIHGTTVAELGLAGGGEWSQVVESAYRRGWTVRPLELAAHLRLQWTNQPEALIEQQPVKHRAPPGSATVTTEPPPDEQDLPWGFYLRRVQDELWLRGYRSWSGHVKRPEDYLVFMRSENARPGT